MNLRLKKQDKVALVSPSGLIEKECIERALMWLESWGLEVVQGKSVLSRNGVFAGSDQERWEDLQEALDHTEIKAIFCTRGGYGAAALLDKLSFDQFTKYPKYLIGFSDITALHSRINALGFPSIHAVMPNSYPASLESNQAMESLYKLLFEPQLSYQLNAEPGNRIGKAKAPMLGGNLSVLYSLRGTPYDIDPQGKILFIEDLNEYYYHIDRMLQNFKQGGKLEGLAGLIVGSFHDMKHGLYSYQESVRQIVEKHVQGTDYPICYDFPSGHILQNRALLLGKTIDLEINETETKLFIK